MNNEFFHLFIIDQGVRESRRRPPHNESFDGRIEERSVAYALRIDYLERMHSTDIEYLIHHNEAHSGDASDRVRRNDRT